MCSWEIMTPKVYNCDILTVICKLEVVLQSSNTHTKHNITVLCIDTVGLDSISHW